MTPSLTPAAAPAPGPLRRMPPAVFPALLGLLGLALAWRRGAGLFALPPALAQALVEGLAGAASLLALVAALAYLAKVARRPKVLFEEVSILPGRAGLAALVLCLYLLGALLVPLWPGAALGCLVLGIGAHLVFVGLLLRLYRIGPREQSRVTPVWHLSFTGFVVAAMLAAMLGLTGLATGLWLGAAAAAALVWGMSGWQLAQARVPAPLRPLLAIHLAPVSLLGTVAVLLGHGGIAAALAPVAAAGLAVLVLRARWLTEAGFSPFWGAFTFPLAATASFLILAGGVWETAGALVLIAATLVIPPIVVRVLALWVKGELAARTNAATA